MEDEEEGNNKEGEATARGGEGKARGATDGENGDHPRGNVERENKRKPPTSNWRVQKRTFCQKIRSTRAIVFYTQGQFM